MPWVKPINFKSTKEAMSPGKYLLWILIFVIIFFATRLPSLGSDVINPDGANWHWRSEQFMVNLKKGNWEGTYQFYHPGVTLMWITGATQEIVKRMAGGGLQYDVVVFPVFHTVIKHALVLVHLILSIIALYLMTRVWDKGLKGFFLSLGVVSLFTFEPFFLANSRVIHLDILVTMFLLNGLLLAYLNIRNFNWITGAASGIFFGLAFLTKSIALGGIVFALVVGGFLAMRQKDLKTAAKYKFSLFLPFIFTVIALFPAMWVRPIHYLLEILSEGERVGIRVGHGQILFGEFTRDAGVLFYPLVLLIKVSPVIWVGILILIYFFIRNFKDIKAKLKSIRLKELFKDPNSVTPALFLFIFYLGYFLVTVYVSKKIDRYMLPVYPFLALLAVYGFERLKKRGLYLAGMLVLLFQVVPLFKLYPYYFTYTSPVFGTPERVNRIIAQKPFGVGLPALKEYILEHYGYYPSLGVLDTKPFETIYPNSRVFDFRIDGTRRYDLLILGPNDEVPDKVLKSGSVFTHDRSMYINGLEYWRIYVKDR